MRQNNPSFSSFDLKDSSSVIQFVTRGSVQVNDGVLEVQNGLSEDVSVSALSRSMKILFYWSVIILRIVEAVGVDLFFI